MPAKRPDATPAPLDPDADAVEPTELLGLGDPNVADEQPPPTFDLGRYVPPTWDVFDIDPVRIAECLDQGLDPTFARVRLYRCDGGPHDGRIAGEFDPWQVTTAWMLANVGPGRYDVKVLNRRALHVTGRRVSVGGPQAAAPTGPQAPPQPPQQTGGPWGGPVQATPQAHPYTPPQPGGFQAAMLGAVPTQAPPPVDPYAQGPQYGGGIQEQMLSAMIQRMVNPPPAPMRDALASMMKMMALGMQNSQQTMQQMATLHATTQPPAGNGAAELLAPMVTSLIGELSRARDSGGAVGGDAQQLLGRLTMGMQLRDQINGDDSEKWLGIVPKLADSMGPGVVAAFATAMIKDPVKSQAVLDTINEHMRARSAEATGELDDSPIGTPPGTPLDTTGTAAA